MAARVNIKFVVGLSVAMVLLLLAVVAVGTQALLKTGDQLVRAGDEQMAAGNYKDAVASYSKAVFKDQRNPEWIRKWIAALEKTTPATRQAYTDEYSGQYMRALRALPEADHADLAAHKRLLDEMYQQKRAGAATLGAWEEMVRNSDEVIGKFRGKEQEAKLLRRYRGLGRAGILGITSDPKPEDVEAARQDLQAALEADPKDDESAVALASVDMAAAESARKRNEDAESARLIDAARARLRAFADQNPPAPGALLALVRIELAVEARRSGGATLADVLRDRQPLLKEAVDAFMAQKPEDTDVNAALVLSQFASQALPDGPATAAKILAHAGEGHPLDPQLISGWARVDTAAGRTDEAIARLQKIVDAPTPPLSLDGLLLESRRNDAVYQQADAALAAWERETDATKRTSLREQAGKLRDSLAGRVGESHTLVGLLDAKLAWMEGNLARAATLLDRYNDQTGQKDASALMLQGQLMYRMGNTGAARQSCERVLQLDGRDTRALLLLARISGDQGDFAAAARFANQAAILMRDNEAVQKMAENYSTIATAGAGGAGKDPALVEMAKAQNQLQAGEAQQAVETLRAAATKFPADVRVPMYLAQILAVDLRDKPGALAVITDALSRIPGDKTLAQMKDRLESTDPVRDMLAQIDASTQPEPQKRLAKYQVHAAAGHTEEAQRELQAAAQLAPDNGAVVEALFGDAFRREDIGEVERLMAVAEGKNVDQVGGLTYRARRDILAAKQAHDAGKHEDARILESSSEAALQQAVERDRLNPEIWRMLGAIRAQLNRPSAAAAAYGKAVEIRPSDIVSVTGYVKALRDSGDPGRALAEARKAKDAGRNNPEFIDLWLDLESATGDRAAAMAARRRMTETQPDNATNRAQLATLLMQAKKWPEARAEIDKIKATPKAPPATVARLEALFFAYQNDAEKAAAVMQQSIDAVPAEKRTTEPYAQAARLMQEMGQVDKAVAFLEGGRPFQKPESMDIDRAMGDLLFNSGRQEQAIAAYKRVLDAGAPDQGDAVAKRMLEAMLISKQYDKVDGMLAGMGERTQKDGTLLLLGAESASRQNDPERARRLYNQAVQADPKSPIVYVKRADFSRQNPDRQNPKASLRDAEADYDQAARLAPGDALPRVRLAEVFLETGRTDQAIEQLQKAIAAAPGSDELRLRHIQLLSAAGRQAEMVDAVKQAVEANNRSFEWLVQGAGIMGGLGRWDEAAAMLSQAFEKNKSPRVALGLVQALVRKAPPDVQSANRVLQTPEIKADSSLSARIMRALVRGAESRKDDAEKELNAAAASLVQNDREQVEVFMNEGVRGVYPGVQDRLAYLGKLSEKTPFTDWMAAHYDALGLELPGGPAEQAAQALEKFAQDSKDPQIQLFAYRLLSGRAYALKKFDASVTLFQKGLAVDPNDVEFNNNLAYVLAKDLGRPQDGLPYAEKAAAKAGDQPLILDTLGTVQLELKQYDKAAATLSGALDRATRDDQKVPVSLHLAKAKAALGDKSGARALLDRAAELMREGSPLASQYGEDLKDLKLRLDAQ